MSIELRTKCCQTGEVLDVFCQSTLSTYILKAEELVSAICSNWTSILQHLLQRGHLGSSILLGIQFLAGRLDLETDFSISSSDSSELIPAGGDRIGHPIATREDLAHN